MCMVHCQLRKQDLHHDRQLVSRKAQLIQLLQDPHVLWNFASFKVNKHSIILKLKLSEPASSCSSKKFKTLRMLFKKHCFIDMVYLWSEQASSGRTRCIRWFCSAAAAGPRKSRRFAHRNYCHAIVADKRTSQPRPNSLQFHLRSTSWDYLGR